MTIKMVGRMKKVVIMLLLLSGICFAANDYDYHIVCMDETLVISRDMINAVSLMMVFIGAAMIVDFAVNYGGRRDARRTEGRIE